MLTLAGLHEELDKGLDPEEVREWLDLWEREQANKEEQADKDADAEEDNT